MLSERDAFKAQQCSEPSCKANVSAARVDFTTRGIFLLCQAIGAYLLFSPRRKVMYPLCEAFPLRFPSDASAKQRNSTLFTSPRLGKISSTYSDFIFLRGLVCIYQVLYCGFLSRIVVWQTSSGLLWVHVLIPAI